MSPHSVESINCRNEINLALAERKEMLIVYLEPTELIKGMRLQLNAVQAIDSKKYGSIDTLVDVLSCAQLLQCCLSKEESFEYLLKAAQQGNANAQCSLGNMYENGQGVPQSYEEAIKWYQLAANQGHADALRKISEVKKEIESNKQQSVYHQQSFYNNSFSSITINGQSFVLGENNVIVNNDNIFVNGQNIRVNATNKVTVMVNGSCNNINTIGSVEVRGSCNNIDCRGSASIKGNVFGNVDAGGSVNCGDVKGYVDAGGSVCYSRRGNGSQQLVYSQQPSYNNSFSSISINGQNFSVCGNNISIKNDGIFVDDKFIQKNISNNITVIITGDCNNVDAFGSVVVGGSSGNIDAGGSVNCGNVNGNIDAGGRVICM